MSFSKVSLSGFFPFRSINSLSPFRFSLPLPFRRVRTTCCTQNMSCSVSSSAHVEPKNTSTRWRPTCLYFTQGKCTMVTIWADPVFFSNIRKYFCIWLLNLWRLRFLVLHVTCSIKSFSEFITRFSLLCKLLVLKHVYGRVFLKYGSREIKH